MRPLRLRSFVPSPVVRDIDRGSRRFSPVLKVVVGTVVVGLLAAGCGGGGGGGALLTAESPQPAGTTPSPISTMICRNEAIQEIDSAVGVKATVSQPTWADHRYSCQYGYPSGSMQLSVKELSSWAQTKAYFRALGVQMGDARTVQNLGQGAFQTTDGSMVVRKDWKVLLVDVADLPSQFGVPPTSSGNVAVAVADVILGCWSGD